MAEREVLPEGYTCRCETIYLHTSYVYAHWDLELTHTCGKCGRKNTLLRGNVTHGVRPTENKD